VQKRKSTRVHPHRRDRRGALRHSGSGPSRLASDLRLGVFLDFGSNITGARGMPAWRMRSAILIRLFNSTPGLSQVWPLTKRERSRYLMLVPVQTELRPTLHVHVAG
jgi:hypothetical protein